MFPETPEISQEVELILEYIVRDFIASWYSSFDERPDSPFLVQLKLVLGKMVQCLQKASSRVDFPELLILKALPLITKHFKEFLVARETVMSRVREDDSPSSEEVSFAIAVEFSKNYRLHEAISLGSEDLDSSLQRYSRDKSAFILQSTLDPRELTSNFVKIISREVLCCCLLTPMLNKLADPDYWNNLISSKAAIFLRERTQVKEIRKVISTHVNTPDLSSDDISPSRDETDIIKMNISVDSTPKQFEEYLKLLNGFDQKQHLKAIKYSILLQLLVLQGTRELSKEEQLYKNRLVLSFNLVESRLKCITTRSVEPPSPTSSFIDTQVTTFGKFVNSITLDNILNHEFSHKCLSTYLNEHDKRGKCCLTFFIRVNELKNPLEDPNSDELAIMSKQDVADLLSLSFEFFSGTNLSTMRALNERYAQDISNFQDARNSAEEEIPFEIYHTARKSTIRMQFLAHEFLQNISLPKFKQSRTFVNMISAKEFRTAELYPQLVTSPRRHYSRQKQHLSQVRATSSS